MNKPKWAVYGLLILGCIFWNAWALGWLNHGSAGYFKMSISELNVANQPYATLFTILEYASGAALFVGSLQLFFVLPRNAHFTAYFIGICICLIGALTIFDAAFPLSCNQYHNRACQLNLRLNRIDTSTQEHDLESWATAYITGFLAVLVPIWVYVNKNLKTSTVVPVLIMIAMAIVFVVLNQNNSVTRGAIAERIWNVLVSLDIVYYVTKVPYLKGQSAKIK